MRDMHRELVPMRVSEPAWKELIQSPKYFLHGINPQTNSFCFLESDRQTLSQAAFLDGRTAISSKAFVHELPIEEILDSDACYQQNTSTPNRFIFHMSFCGSTLLARTLDLRGQTFSYKEPQIILQLAALKSQGHPYHQDRERWRTLIEFVLAQFKLPWGAHESNIIKPSNWANTILPELTLDAGDSKVVLLSIDRQRFLESAFRGGGERLKFVYSVLQHLQTAFPHYSPILEKLDSEPLDTVDLFARVVLIVHAVQQQAFDRVRALIPASSVYACCYNNLLSEPIRTAGLAANTLDLNLSEEDIEKSVSNNYARHSKVGTRAYNPQQSLEVNLQVRRTYQDKFDAALEWANQHLCEEALI